MQRFDAFEMQPDPDIEHVSADQLQHVRAHLAADFNHGHDAWPAVVWLAATKDRFSKHAILDELYQILNGATSALLDAEAAASNVSSNVVFGRAAVDRRRVGRAFDFATVLHRSMPSAVPIDASDVSNELVYEVEVERRRELARQQAEREAELVRLGVELGSGVPFWQLYMSRRSKKSWG